LTWWGNDVNTQYASTGYTNLWNGTYAWPAINNNATSGDVGKAYDLWHAAINSRGLAFSAESPADLRRALDASLNRIKATMAAQSAVATSSSSLNNGTVVFEASFTSSDWHGVVSAFGITNGAINTTPKWTTLNTGSFAPAATRTVITSKSGTPAAGNGIQFSSADATFNTMWGGVAGANANVLNWLRGDATTEIRNGGAYRNRRTTVLGDVVDSGPVFAWHENFGYAGLPEGMSATPNYTTYISTKASAAGTNYQGTGMVYVGANDGIVHRSDVNSGVELFVYVPHSGVPNLPALADPAYSHQFYVDQTPYVGDACVGSGPTSCSWKTVLVGTTGAGGQGVFAIDVTSPASMEAGSSAAANVLWDLDGYSTTNTGGDPDLGFPIGKPIIARLNNGDWAAVFGNGYLSKNGCAVLFIVRLSDGAMTKIGSTGTAGTTVCNAVNPNASNGLGPVALSDVDGNMTTDFVYAGDLQGNMWKFDLTSASSGGWTVALGGQPLVAASPGCTPAATSTAPSTCQPITSAPVLGPALPGLTGTMVYFGTGRMFAVGDLTATSTQSFYGILDNGVAVSSSALVQEVATDNGNTRTVTANVVAPPKLGWFMNLPDTGERVTMSPLLVDNFVVFATEVPTSNPCSAGGSGWIMAVSATTKTVGGTDFFVGSPGINGIQSTVGVIQGITVLSDSTHSQDRFLAGGTQGVQTFSSAAFSVKGRISWHELTR
jgi:type IV pilus assembly protein PilY1